MRVIAQGYFVAVEFVVAKERTRVSRLIEMTGQMSLSG